MNDTMQIKESSKSCFSYKEEHIFNSKGTTYTVNDVGPTLYKCYTICFCLLGTQI